MSLRAIASGTISFGLVSIPVKLYSTAKSANAVTFHWLHDACGTRVKQQYMCPTDEEVVPREAMVKGYEFAKGQYVKFSPKELKAVEQVSTQAIEIAEFIPESKLDWVFFDKAYFLGPDKGGEKAYCLLRAAMRETKRTAVARYAARGKQYLVLVRPHENGLVLQQLHYADALNTFAEVPLEEVELGGTEVQLAVQLIEQIAGDGFRPERYKDEVKERVLELIQQKIDGQEITAAPSGPPQAQIVDLMDALKASLGLEGGGSSAATKRKPAKKAGGGRRTRKTKTSKAGKKAKKLG